MEKIYNDTIIDILDQLSNYHLDGYNYSLTLNYKRIVDGFTYTKFDIRSIKDIINKHGDIKSFNLTISNHGRYDETRYKSYWNSTDLIFYSGGIVLNFVSDYLSTNPNGLKVSSINKLFEIYKEYRISSRRLYDVIKNN